MANKYCGNCGTEIPEGARFCLNCGQSFEHVDSIHNSKKEHKVNKKSLYALAVVFGILLLIIAGAMYYADFTDRREARIAREKFVADSLKQVRQDSLRLAEQLRRDSLQLVAQKEKEEKEARKHADFQKKFTLENIVVLINNISNLNSRASLKYAQKCGLSLIYEYEHVDGEWWESRWCYGYDVEKGEKMLYSDGSFYRYKLKAKSNKAVYVEYGGDGDSESTLICFKDNKDAKRFMNESKHFIIEDQYYWYALKGWYWNLSKEIEYRDGWYMIELISKG